MQQALEAAIRIALQSEPEVCWCGCEYASESCWYASLPVNIAVWVSSPDLAIMLVRIHSLGTHLGAVFSCSPFTGHRPSLANARNLYYLSTRPLMLAYLRMCNTTHRIRRPQQRTSGTGWRQRVSLRAPSPPQAVSLWRERSRIIVRPRLPSRAKRREVCAFSFVVSLAPRLFLVADSSGEWGEFAHFSIVFLSLHMLVVDRRNDSLVHTGLAVRM